MSITRADTGQVLFLCHRAKCGASGSLYGSRNLDTSSCGTTEPTPAPVPVPDLWLIEPESPAMAFWREHVSTTIAPSFFGLYRTAGAPIAWKLRGVDGLSRGVQTRSKVPGIPGRKYVHTYAEPGRPAYSYFPSAIKGRALHVAIVEDCFSGAACAARGLGAVALTGTHLNADVASELTSRHYFDPHVLFLVMLDPGAERAAVQVLNTLRMLGAQARTVYPPKDIKDMSYSEQSQFLDPFLYA